MNVAEIQKKGSMEKKPQVSIRIYLLKSYNLWRKKKRNFTNFNTCTFKMSRKYNKVTGKWTLEAKYIPQNIVGNFPNFNFTVFRNKPTSVGFFYH